MTWQVFRYRNLPLPCKILHLPFSFYRVGPIRHLVCFNLNGLYLEVDLGWAFFSFAHFCRSLCHDFRFVVTSYKDQDFLKYPSMSFFSRVRVCFHDLLLIIIQAVRAPWAHVGHEIAFCGGWLFTSAAILIVVIQHICLEQLGLSRCRPWRIPSIKLCPRQLDVHTQYGVPVYIWFSSINDQSKRDLTRAPVTLFPFCHCLLVMFCHKFFIFCLSNALFNIRFCYWFYYDRL